MRETIAVWPFFLALCTLAALHRGCDATVRYDPGEPETSQTLELDWSAEEINQRFGGGVYGKYRGADLESYLAAAQHLLATGTFEADYLHFWPGGMPFTIAAVLALTGGERYVLKMILVAILVWSIALTIASRAAKTGRRSLDLAWPAALLLFPAMRLEMFGFGAIMSESLSCAFFVISVAVLARGIAAKSAPMIVLAGAILGVATNFRAAFEYAAHFMLAGVAIVLLAIHLVQAARKRVALKSMTWVLSFALAYGAFQAVLAPWRLYKKDLVGKTRLVSLPPEVIYAWTWVPDERQPYFHKAGNTACHVDPELCAKIQADKTITGKQLEAYTFETFFKNPLAWYAHRIEKWNWWWWGRSWSDLFHEPLVFLEGLVLLLLWLGGSALLARDLWRRRDEKTLALTAVAIAFPLMNLAVFTFYMYEWRYSMPLRLFGFFLPLWVVALRRRTSKEPEAAAP